MLTFIKMLTRDGATAIVPRDEFAYAVKWQNEDTLLAVRGDGFFTKLKTKQICNMFTGPDWAPVHMKTRAAKEKPGPEGYRKVRAGRFCINPLAVRLITSIDILYDGDEEETPSSILLLPGGLSPVVTLTAPAVAALLQKATSPESQEQDGMNDEDDEEENADS